MIVGRGQFPISKWFAITGTGVYWKPIYTILEGAFEIVMANAQHVKKVPGRKTDVKDAEWIADLLCHGLLRASDLGTFPTQRVGARLYSADGRAYSR
jgi:transposase